MESQSECSQDGRGCREAAKQGKRGCCDGGRGPSLHFPPHIQTSHTNTHHTLTHRPQMHRPHTACLSQFLSQHALRVLWAPLLPEALPVPWGGQEAPGSRQGLGECNGPCLDAPPSQGSPPSSPSPWLRAGGSQQQPLVRLGGH